MMPFAKNSSNQFFSSQPPVFSRPLQQPWQICAQTQTTNRYHMMPFANNSSNQFFWFSSYSPQPPVPLRPIQPPWQRTDEMFSSRMDAVLNYAPQVSMMQPFAWVYYHSDDSYDSDDSDDSDDFYDSDVFYNFDDFYESYDSDDSDDSDDSNDSDDYNDSKDSHNYNDSDEVNSQVEVEEEEVDCAKELIASMGEYWKEALSGEFTKTYFIELMEFLREEMRNHTICPPLHQVFSWTRHCSPDEIKVVIIGQDPYSQPGRAHGLAFSVENGPPQYSLKNIFKELETDESLEDFEIPSHGNLTGWAEQGVLLFNTVLTVRARAQNSHKNEGWEKFTDAVIVYLNENFTGIVFMLWGESAKKKGSIINQDYHKVLETSHPSPLSAKRGFVGCKHFSRANEYLKANGKGPIHWERLKKTHSV